MKNNIYNEEELLFKKINKILSDTGYEYWICHGTLLGVIRDNIILPWDHDIDFAVWKDKIEIEKIEKLFIEHGYEQEYIFGEMDCLHFISDTNKKVDISFYDVKDGIASIKWIAPSTTLKGKMFYYTTEALFRKDQRVNDVKTLKVKLANFLQNIIILIRPIFSNKLKNRWYKYAQKYFTYTGYSYPVELMKFKTIKFLDENVPIPINSEKCMELTYGEDWKTPKKNYVWYDEAINLIDLKD